MRPQLGVNLQGIMPATPPSLLHSSNPRSTRPFLFTAVRHPSGGVAPEDGFDEAQENHGYYLREQGIPVVGAGRLSR